MNGWTIDIGDGNLHPDDSFITAHSLAPMFALEDTGPHYFTFTEVQHLNGGLWPATHGKMPTGVTGSVLGPLVIRRACFLGGVDFEPIWEVDLSYDWTFELIAMNRAASTEEIRTQNYKFAYINFALIICLRPDMFPFPPDISHLLLKQYLRLYLEILEDKHSCDGELPISIGILNPMDLEVAEMGEKLASMVDNMFRDMA